MTWYPRSHGPPATRGPGEGETVHPVEHGQGRVAESEPPGDRRGDAPLRTPTGGSVPSHGIPIRTVLFTARRVQRLRRRGPSTRPIVLTVGAMWADEGVERAHGRTDMGRAATGPLPRTPPGQLPVRVPRMHPQAVLRAQRPGLPQTLGDGFLGGIGNDRQRDGGIVRRFRIQVIAVPFAVGESDVDVLRLVRVVGRKGQQLQGLLVGKGRRQVPVEEAESPAPQGVLGFTRRGGARGGRTDYAWAPFSAGRSPSWTTIGIRSPRVGRLTARHHRTGFRKIGPGRSGCCPVLTVFELDTEAIG